MPTCLHARRRRRAAPRRGSADAKTDLGATTLYCDFLRGLSAGFIDGFVSGWNHSLSSYQLVFAAQWERGRTDGKQAVQRADRRRRARAAERGGAAEGGE